MLQDHMLDKNIPVPLYFQLKTLILDEIKNGSYKSGDLIPTENEISEMFDISRTTVRQAITELVHDGQLYRIKSKGTFVANPKVTQHVLNRFFTFDEAAEASGRTAEMVQLKKEIVPMPQEMIDLGAGKPGDRAIYLYRLRKIDEIPAVRIEAYLVYNKFPEFMEMDLVHNRLRNLMDARPETRVYRMVRTIDAVPATKEDINILDVEPGSAIQKMTTVRYNEVGEVLDMAAAYHRGDMNRIQVEILNPRE